MEIQASPHPSSLNRDISILCYIFPFPETPKCTSLSGYCPFCVCSPQIVPPLVSDRLPLRLFHNSQDQNNKTRLHKLKSQRDLPSEFFPDSHLVQTNSRYSWLKSKLK